MPRTRIRINPKNYLDRIKQSDDNARDEFIMKFLPRVRKLVDVLEITPIYREDIIQVGMLAVIEALENYNHESSTPFSIHAYQTIMYHISKYLNSIMPFSGFNLYRLNQAEIIALMNSESKEDLEKYLKIATSKDYEYILVKTEAYTDDEHSEEILSLEDLALDNVELEEILSYLTPRKRQILILNYGLFDNIPISTKKIASMFNVSGSCIRDHRSQALKKIKKIYLAAHPELRQKTSR